MMTEPERKEMALLEEEEIDTVLSLKWRKLERENHRVVVAERKPGHFHPFSSQTKNLQRSQRTSCLVTWEGNDAELLFSKSIDWTQQKHSKSWGWIIIFIKIILGTGEMVHWLRDNVALAENPGSISRNCMVAHNHQQLLLQLQGIQQGHIWWSIQADQNA